MKKILLLLPVFLLTSCVFDAKDQCLDAGGSFDETTKQCVHSASGSADTATGDVIDTASEMMPNALPEVTYPTNATDNVAAKSCQEKGGVISTENKNGVDVLYCEIDGEKQDAWKMLTDQQ